MNIRGNFTRVIIAYGWLSYFPVCFGTPFDTLWPVLCGLVSLSERPARPPGANVRPRLALGSPVGKGPASIPHGPRRPTAASQEGRDDMRPNHNTGEYATCHKCRLAGDTGTRELLSKGEGNHRLHTCQLISKLQKLPC